MGISSLGKRLDHRSTYRTELIECRAEMGPPYSPELGFEEIAIYQEIRNGIFIHHRDVPTSQKVLIIMIQI